MSDELRKVLTADDQLDDVGRARMWSRLDDRISAPAPRARAWPIAAGVVACAAAAIAVWLVRRAPSDAWVAPADATLTMRIGPHTDAALIGPGRLSMVGEPGEVTRVRLERGTLLAEFTGGPGRALHVDAPGMQIDVVGTLFAVELAPARTCVSVVHGRVRAVIDDHEAYVDGGQRACTHDAAPRAIEPRMLELLTRHETMIVAAREPMSDSSAMAPPAVTVSPIVPVTPAAPVPPIVPVPPPAPVPPTVIASPTVPAPPATHAAAPAAPIAAPAQPVPAHASSRPPRVLEPAPPPAPAPAAQVVATAPRSEALPAPSPVNPSPAPAAPAPPPPAAAAPPAPTADDLYRTAELALAKRDDAAADRALAQLIASAPSSPLAGQALYERARIAYQHHAWPDARRHLDALAKRSDTALAESGHYLTCRIAVDSQDREAARCFIEFRAAFPRSAHDRDVLGTLAQLAFQSGGCTAANAHVAELASRYPHSALAAAWRAKCPEAR
jgi:hypothetical protein